MRTGQPGERTGRLLWPKGLPKRNAPDSSGGHAGFLRCAGMDITWPIDAARKPSQQLKQTAHSISEQSHGIKRRNFSL